MSNYEYDDNATYIVKKRVGIYPNDLVRVTGIHDDKEARLYLITAVRNVDKIFSSTGCPENGWNVYVTCPHHYYQNYYFDDEGYLDIAYLRGKLPGCPDDVLYGVCNVLDRECELI